MPLTPRTPPGQPLRPDTWDECFELLHRLWSAHGKGEYSVSERRRWGRLLEGLEHRATLQGWTRPGDRPTVQSRPE